MIQHGATVCIREVTWRFAYSESLVSDDLGIVMLLPEGLDWGWIPVFRADGIWEVVCKLPFFFCLQLDVVLEYTVNNNETAVEPNHSAWQPVWKVVPSVQQGIWSIYVKPAEEVCSGCLRDSTKEPK